MIFKGSLISETLLNKKIAQKSDIFGTLFGDFSQSEKLSEIKPPLGKACTRSFDGTGFAFNSVLPKSSSAGPGF